MKCIQGCDDNFVFDDNYGEYICCQCGWIVGDEE